MGGAVDAKLIRADHIENSQDSHSPREQLLSEHGATHLYLLSAPAQRERMRGKL